MSISNVDKRKQIKQFIKSKIAELDKVFKSYKSKTQFEFNIDDTLFIMYESPAESPFTSDIIIWSGKDTISYKQGFETIKPFKYKRTITYASFRPTMDKPSGLKIITERDSLITLVAHRDYKTINQLGDNQNISDGSYVNIYVAYKSKEQYEIESCSPKQFIILDTYRKE
jgi:hypothetical protein